MSFFRVINRGNSTALLLALIGLAGSAAYAQGLQLPSASGSGAAASAVGRPASPQGVADYLVAVVNSEPVTNTEVAERALRLGQQMALQGAGRPSQPELLQLALDVLINEKLQLQLAERANIKIDEAAIRDAELNVAALNRIPLAEVLRRLELDGISREQFHKTLRNQLTMTRLREREVDSRVTVSDNEVEQQLKEIQNSSASPDLELNIAQVLIAVPERTLPSQLAALQARAQRILERARKGEDFSALAREFSDGPEASDGGQMGLRPIERLPEVFVNAVKGLAEGSVADLVRSGAGFHVLKLIDREDPGGLPSRLTQFRARHILLRMTPQLSEGQGLERLAAFRGSIEAGAAEFSALARQHSQDGSAREGGDLGWLSSGQTAPEFEGVMNDLQPGEISVPFSSRFGVHLVQLIERRDVPVGDRERRSMVRNLVRQRKIEEAHDLWMREVRANAFVQLREPPQ